VSATASTTPAAKADAGESAQASLSADVHSGSTRWLAILRLLLLPIVFAGDRLVAHPKVGTTDFNLIFLLACVYALLALADSRRSRMRLPLWMLASLDLLFVCALTFESGGAFSQLLWAFLFLPLGAAILLDPRRTAAVSAVTAIAYLVVALTHPATHSQQLGLVLVQGLYIAWVDVAAVVLSSLLARRWAGITALASERGSLVAQALAAEDRARQRLADDLHDAAIQNLLAARQDLAEARGGETAAIDRAESAIRVTLGQLRSTVRELHPYVLEQLGLQAALETLAEQHAQRGSYRIEMRIDPDVVGVCDQLIVSLARELLANVTRHADATHLTLELAGDAHTIELYVTDDGCGFEDRQLLSSLREGHIGLASCRERVQAMGGRFEILSALGSGTTVHCTIPRQTQRPPHDRSLDGRSFQDRQLAGLTEGT
jgi:two-component system NarL family sensor kinase